MFSIEAPLPRHGARGSVVAIKLEAEAVAVQQEPWTARGKMIRAAVNGHPGLMELFAKC